MGPGARILTAGQAPALRAVIPAEAGIHFNRDRNPLSAVSRFSIPCTGNVSTPRIQDTFPALTERASARNRSSSLSGEAPS